MGGSFSVRTLSELGGLAHAGAGAAHSASLPRRLLSGVGKVGSGVVTGAKGAEAVLGATWKVAKFSALGYGAYKLSDLFDPAEMTEAQLKLLEDKPLLVLEKAIYLEHGAAELYHADGNPPIMYDHTNKKAYSVTTDSTGAKVAVEIETTLSDGKISSKRWSWGGARDVGIIFPEEENGKTKTGELDGYGVSTFSSKISEFEKKAADRRKPTAEKLKHYQDEFEKLPQEEKDKYVALQSKFPNIATTVFFADNGAAAAHGVTLNDKAGFYALCKMMEKNELDLGSQSALEMHPDFVKLSEEKIFSSYVPGFEVAKAEYDKRLGDFKQRTAEAGAPDEHPDKGMVKNFLNNMANNRGTCIAIGIALTCGLGSMVSGFLPLAIRPFVGKPLGLALIALPFFGTSAAEKAVGFLDGMDLSETSPKDDAKKQVSAEVKIDSTTKTAAEIEGVKLEVKSTTEAKVALNTKLLPTEAQQTRTSTVRNGTEVPSPVVSTIAAVQSQAPSIV